MPDIVKHLEEPLSDASIIPTYYVCKLARENVKTVLSGEGGDETFAGYTRYYWDSKADIYSKIPKTITRGLIKPLTSILPEGQKESWKNIPRRIKKFAGTAYLPFVERYLKWFALYSEGEKKEIYTKDFKDSLSKFSSKEVFQSYTEELNNGNHLKRCQYVDINTMLLDDLLLKVDKISMMHSLEVRVPFLDHKLVEFVFNLPNKWKLKGTESKYILKEWLEDFMPSEIINRKKAGFEVPVDKWFRGALSDFTNDLLGSQKFKERGIFENDKIGKYLRKHQKGEKSFGKEIFTLIILELWMREFLDE